MSEAPAAVCVPRETLQRAVHDLKNPLAVIRATLEWLEVEIAHLPDACEALTDASSATARLLGVIEDLHMLSTFDVADLQSSNVLLADVVEGAITPAAQRVAARGVCVEARGLDRAVATNGDVVLLTRAVEMLVDASSHGAPSNLVLVVEARVQQGRASIVITGEGGNAKVPRIPTGLSLYVAERILVAHGGTLSVALGGTVTASLPLA